MLRFNATMNLKVATQNETLLETKHKGSSKRLLQNEESSIQGDRITNFERFPRINNGTISINDTVYFSLDAHLLPFNSEHFCADSLTFSWECTNYTENLMLI